MFVNSQKHDSEKFLYEVMEGKTNVLILPNELIDKVMSYISYEEVSHLRLVCKRFDNCAQRILNQGFHKVERFHSECCQKVKEQLPRRESERRKHPLATHCDILTAIKTRLSLLGMTFMKFVDLKQCCFIPGKVLDELFKILRMVSNTNIPRTHDILQELRDISSMAMEHFDEKIAPNFQKPHNDNPKFTISNSGKVTGSTSHSCYPRSTSFQPSIQYQQFLTVRSGYRQLLHKYRQMKKQNISVKHKMSDYSRKLNLMDRRISEQNSMLLEQGTCINDQNNKFEEISNNFREHSKYMNEIMAHINNISAACITCSHSCPILVKSNEQFVEQKANDDGDNEEEEESSSRDESPKKRLKKETS